MSVPKQLGDFNLFEEDRDNSREFLPKHYKSGPKNFLAELITLSSSHIDSTFSIHMLLINHICCAGLPM